MTIAGSLLRKLHEQSDIGSQLRSSDMPADLLKQVSDAVRAEKFHDFDWQGTTLYVGFVGNAVSDNGLDWDVHLLTRPILSADIFDDRDAAVEAMREQIDMQNKRISTFGEKTTLAFATVVPVIRGIAQAGQMMVRVTSDGEVTSDLNKYGSGVKSSGESEEEPELEPV